MIDGALHGKFAELIDYMIKTFQKVGEELPAVAVDLITSGLVKFMGFGVAGTLFIIGMVVIHQLCGVRTFQKPDSRAILQAWAVVFGFFAFLIASFGYVMALRVYLAPRWYILEYLRGVIQ